MEIKEETEKAIRDIQEFTDSYWKLLQEKLHNEVIEGIIENRNSYVRKLEEFIETL